MHSADHVLRPAGDGPGICQRLESDLIEFGDWHDDLVCYLFGINWRLSRDLARSLGIVRVNTTEHQNLKRKQHDNHPGAIRELGRRNHE